MNSFSQSTSFAHSHTCFPPIYHMLAVVCSHRLFKWKQKEYYFSCQKSYCCFLFVCFFFCFFMGIKFCLSSRKAILSLEKDKSFGANYIFFVVYTSVFILKWLLASYSLVMWLISCLEKKQNNFIHSTPCSRNVESLLLKYRGHKIHC